MLTGRRWSRTGHVANERPTLAPRERVIDLGHPLSDALRRHRSSEAPPLRRAGTSGGVSLTAAATPLFQRAVSRDVPAHLAKGFRRRDVGCKLLL
jgi:hypothetical protein